MLVRGDLGELVCVRFEVEVFWRGGRVLVFKGKGGLRFCGV